jgi:hypothetical protein
LVPYSILDALLRETRFRGACQFLLAGRLVTRQMAGVPLSDLSLSTLAGQVGGCTVLLRPLYELIRAHVLPWPRPTASGPSDRRNPQDLKDRPTAFVPPSWCGAPWLANGRRREVILAALRASMAKKRDGAPVTVSHFERAIARAHAEPSAPLPTFLTYLRANRFLSFSGSNFG